MIPSDDAQSYLRRRAPAGWTVKRTMGAVEIKREDGSGGYFLPNATDEQIDELLQRLRDQTSLS